MSTNDYHSYIYDRERRVIRGDFESAYANCDDVWPTQHQLDLPHFVYLKGLVREKARVLGRVVRVLDIGCGYGDLVHALNAFSECRAFGIEISHSAAVKGLKRLGTPVPLVVGDVNKGLPTADRSFDVVLVLGVFWFLLEYAEFCLAEIDRVAASGADVVFTLHVPPNPIGGEVISSNDDFLSLLRTRFEVVDGFTFYQPAALAAHLPLARTPDDVLFRCRRKVEG